MATKRTTKKSVADSLSPEELTKQLKDVRGCKSIIEFLAARGIKSPLVIVGEEELRIRRLVSWIRERFNECETPPQVSQFSGSQLSSAAAVRSVIQTQNTLSLFAPLNLVVVSEVELLKAAVGKPLVEALRTPSPCSFFIATGAPPNQKTVVLNDLLAAGTVVQLEPLKGESMRRWIVQEVARLGITGGITPEAAELLSRSYEGALDVLSQDLSRIALLLDDQQPITADIVRAHLRTVQDHTSFELLIHIARKNIAGVCAVTRRLVAEGLHPLQLCSFLSRAVRIMVSQSAPVSEKIPGELSNPWITRQIKPAMNLLSETELKGMLHGLLALDEALKSSGIPPEQILELHLVNMALRTTHLSKAESWVMENVV